MKNSGFYFFSSLFGLFLFSAFYFAPGWVSNAYIHWGWLLFSGVSFALVAGSLFKRQIKLPSQKFLIPVLGFVLLAVVFSLAAGSNLFEEKWEFRWLTLLGAWGLFQVFESEHELIRSLKFPLLGFVLALCGESIYQNFILCHNSTLGTSCYSSRFYNINMLSQSLLCGMVLLEYFRSDKVSKWTGCLFDVALFASLFCIVYSHSRSSYIALALYLGSRALVGSKEFIRVCVPLFFAVLLLNVDHRGDASATAPLDKQSSTNYRMELYRGSLRLIAENPLGIGINNFEYGFIPYRNEGMLAPTIAEVDKTPHNDFLLMLAEEGWAVGLCFAGLLAWFSLQSFVVLKSKKASVAPGFLLVILPELFFQFPSDMWFFSFCVAVVLALLSYEMGQIKNFKASFDKRALALAFSVLISIGAFFRFSLFWPTEKSAHYCQVYHDNWKNCAAYFKAHYDHGEYLAAQNTMLPIVKYQPFNFVLINWDYLLNHTDRNKTIACNYAALFKFQITIPGSDISGCDRDIDKNELIRRFRDFSALR